VAHGFSGTHRHRAVVVDLNDKAAASAADEPPQQGGVALGDDRVSRFVRLDAVALSHSRLEELIEGAPAIAARVGLTSHSVTVTDHPAEPSRAGEEEPLLRCEVRRPLEAVRAREA
jgi:hypothetical protein